MGVDCKCRIPRHRTVAPISAFIDGCTDGRTRGARVRSGFATSLPEVAPRRSSPARRPRPQQPLRQHGLKIPSPVYDQHHAHSCTFDAIDQPPEFEQYLAVGIDVLHKQLFGVATAVGRLLQALHGCPSADRAGGSCWCGRRVRRDGGAVLPGLFRRCG